MTEPDELRRLRLRRILEVSVEPPPRRVGRLARVLACCALAAVALGAASSIRGCVSEVRPCR